MSRTSPCHYIAPSAVSIIPNANQKASDLAVYVARGCKIKVYSEKIPELGYENSTFQEWTLAGRNRRLADPSVPYTVYARLLKTDKTVGYLVFAPKISRKVDDKDVWPDKYPYVTMNGLATDTAGTDTGNYWYVKIGDVSLPESGVRTVPFDTGILGTDQYNSDWGFNPDEMPLRVEIGFFFKS
jgi:hypothetical protein